MTYRKLIVPLDGSPLSECALPLAFALAGRTSAQVFMLVAVEPAERGPAAAPPVFAGFPRGPAGPGAPRSAGPGASAGTQDHAVAEARRYLDGIAAGYSTDKARATAGTATGDPAEAILATAEREQADLIVMATHGRSGLARTVLGSVTDRVARQSTVPVLVVSSSCAPGAPVQEVTVGTVLVPLDRSELSESAIPQAVSVAGPFHAGLLLLTVVPQGASPEQAETARQYLEKVALRDDLSEARVSVAVASGDPGSEIAAQLALLPCPLIVMTTRGASGLKRWIRGSVTDAVIRAGLAPTMVVPPVAPLLGPAIH